MASPVALHTNLISEVYAKVIAHSEASAFTDGQPRVRLGLTSVPEISQRVLDRQRTAVS